MDDLKNNKRIKIPESFFKKILEERLRTGCGGSKLLRGRKDIPKGLKSDIMNKWLSRKVETAKPLYMEYVLQKYAELPSGNLVVIKKRYERNKKRKEPKNYVEIDSELIRSHMERSGLTTASILSLLKKQGLDYTFSQINRVINGVQEQVYKPDYEVVLKCLSNAPDYQPPAFKPVKKSNHKLRAGYITLSPKIIERLQFYRSKRLLPYGIFENIPFAPENPRPRNVIVWFEGKNASIQKREWEFIEYHCEKALKAMKEEA